MTRQQAIQRLEKLREARVRAAVQSSAPQVRENAQANADALLMAIDSLNADSNAKQMQR